MIPLTTNEFPLGASILTKHVPRSIVLPLFLYFEKKTTTGFFVPNRDRLGSLRDIRQFIIGERVGETVVPRTDK